MNGLGLYKLEGKLPVRCDDLLSWGVAMQADRHVASVWFGQVLVSTVFLGLDHSWCGGPPLLFETMVFGGPLDRETDRYSTWEEAETGHRLMVERVQQAMAPPNNHS